ncbi:MAG: type II toxin-antitoxin system RelE/ParE family toxin [Defluviitaleaceae bacterium]|nr:type II toxin-antitoxin system RelE/ParE family toxin [Defluviitaleaceae bacterium]
MFKIFAYTDKNGKSPIDSYIGELMSKNDKNSRINANKIMDCIAYLRKYGAQAREPYAKHIDGEIWELRPIRNRILYAAWDGNSFILLHLFKKDTQKTPKREIEQAKRNLADYRERRKNDE